jgi:hypothetical protein
MVKGKYLKYGYVSNLGEKISCAFLNLKSIGMKKTKTQAKGFGVLDIICRFYFQIHQKFGPCYFRLAEQI